jgi:hypothetical protein
LQDSCTIKFAVDNHRLEHLILYISHKVEVQIAAEGSTFTPRQLVVGHSERGFRHRYEHIVRLVAGHNTLQAEDMLSDKGETNGPN